jgi:signal transduction histidine kinase
VKFTPDGGRVTVTAGRSGDSSYEVRVTDSGRGIDPADQPFVFDRFFRGTGTRSVKGAGLGLAIARWVAQAHDGNLTLEKSDSAGTTFLLRLQNKESHEKSGTRPHGHVHGNS